MSESQILCFDEHERPIRIHTVLRNVEDGRRVRVTDYMTSRLGMSLIARDDEAEKRVHIRCTALDRGTWVVADGSPVPAV